MDVHSLEIISRYQAHRQALYTVDLSCRLQRIHKGILRAAIVQAHAGRTLQQVVGAV